MRPLPSDRHRGYARTLAVATGLATALLAGFLVLAPAPPLRPYELRERPSTPWTRQAPLQLLAVQKVAAENEPLAAEGPLADLEPDPWWPDVAAAAPPGDVSARLHVAPPRFDFQPITQEMLATQALFRMEPVFDELPGHLPLDRVVVVRVRVTEEGKVVEAHVTKGLDHALDQHALQAAWHYRLAANANGERPDWVTLPYEFLGRP